MEQAGQRSPEPGGENGMQSSEVDEFNPTVGPHDERAGYDCTSTATRVLTLPLPGRGLRDERAVNK